MQVGDYILAVNGVILDPNKEWTVDHQVLHQQVDYSPFDGMKLVGAPVLTLSRGEVVSEKGQPKVERGRGRSWPAGKPMSREGSRISRLPRRRVPRDR